MHAARLGLIACLLAAAPAARASEYVWTDEQGTVHITDDLSQVPRSQRPQAEQAARASEQEKPAARFASPAAPAPAAAGSARIPATARSAAPRAAPEASGRGRRHVLQVERAGSEMRVIAELDGGVRVPFILDTGAAICTVPAWAVKEMGITIDESTPVAPVVGISGQPMYVPEIEVGSVAVGEAVVENVEMRVLDTMQEGLLGMPFFNHFRVSTDPLAGTITLEEIDASAASEDVIGGLNERAWRGKFAQRRAALEAVRKKLAELPREYVTIRERLEKEEAQAEQQLEDLETKATRENVPQSWRD
jgi:hypothetical protein